MRAIVRVLEGKVTNFPLHLESPLEYVSSPDEYRYELFLGGHRWNIADFSALSKDRTLFTMAVALLAVLLASLIGVLT